MQVFSVHKTKLHIFQEKLHGQNLPWHAQPPFVQEQPHPVDCAVHCAADYHLSRTPSQPLYWCQAHRYFLVALPASRIPPCWLSTSPESSCQLPREDLAMVWLCLENWKGKIREKAKWKLNVEMFTLVVVKMIQIWTFPAAPSTERVPTLLSEKPI